jgi:hypothetical protein
MSIPFTIGKLIDYFSSTTPVRMIFSMHCACSSIHVFISQQIPYGFSLAQASAALLLLFTMGGLANAGRAFLMRMSGLSILYPSLSSSSIPELAPSIAFGRLRANRGAWLGGLLIWLFLLLPFFSANSVVNLSVSTGQRIVARLRERTYEASLSQEVEYVEKGEGDVLSRLSVDSSIVGERYASLILTNPSTSELHMNFITAVSRRIFRMVSVLL